MKHFHCRYAQQQPGGASSITDKWSEQMSNIANKRNDYNDAFERLAEQEAQGEAKRLQEVGSISSMGSENPFQTFLTIHSTSNEK